MSTVSISSVAVSTRNRGYCTADNHRNLDLEYQGDAGWGVATKDRAMVRYMVSPMHWETRPRRSR